MIHTATYTGTCMYNVAIETDLKQNSIHTVNSHFLWGLHVLLLPGYTPNLIFTCTWIVAVATINTINFSLVGVWLLIGAAFINFGAIPLCVSNSFSAEPSQEWLLSCFWLELIINSWLWSWEHLFNCVCDGYYSRVANNQDAAATYTSRIVSTQLTYSQWQIQDTS